MTLTSRAARFLRVAQTQSRNPSYSRSTHSHSPHFQALQKLKDDLLDDTEWPVVMQWFNEDH